MIYKIIQEDTNVAASDYKNAVYITASFWIRSWSHIATHLVVVVLFVGATLFKSDQDEIWQDCSWSKYASIDGVGFSTYHHTFKMAAMTSFHAKSAAIWWVHTQRSLSIRYCIMLLYAAYAAASSGCRPEILSIQFLIDNTSILVNSNFLAVLV